MQERPLTSPEGDSLFRFRLYSTEGVGLAVTQDERSYFLFDSAEYWSDLRQVSAPRELKCACKGHWFHATCLYHPTADGQDYRLLELRTQCAQCERTRTALSVEIDYGPTDSLYREPLSRCQAPDLKYRTRSLSSFWIPEDLHAFLAFLSQSGAYIQATQRIGQSRKLLPCTLEQALALTPPIPAFYVSPVPLQLPERIIPGGTAPPHDPWRAHECLEIASPTHMAYDGGLIGYLYNIRFADEYIENGHILAKSPAFRELARQAEDWLRAHYSGTRGKHCYDNATELHRLFGAS